MFQSKGMPHDYDERDKTNKINTDTSISNDISYNSVYDQRTNGLLNTSL